MCSLLVVEKYRDRSRLFQIISVFCVGIFVGIVLLIAYENGLATNNWEAPANRAASGNSNIDHSPVVSSVSGADAANTALDAHHTDPRQDSTSSTSLKGSADSDLMKLWKANNDFESTVRSCFASDCYNIAYDMKDGTKEERVGFLSPDTRGMSSLIKLLLRFISSVPLKSILFSKLL